jgi:hypothetical protein
MKNVLFMLVVLVVLFSLNSNVFAGPPCPPGTMSCSENYAVGTASPAAKTVLTDKEKRVHLITFSETMSKAPTTAIYPALKRAEEWLAKQNRETIMSQSQTVTCLRSSNCDAFVTVMYWSMEETTKK